MKRKTFKKARWCNRFNFLSPIYFTICTSQVITDNTTKKLGAGPLGVTKGKAATTHFFKNDKGEHTAIVCLYDYKSLTAAEVNALIVHEALHIWQEITEIIGENKPSREFEAYMVQGICFELFTEYERQTK